MKGYSLVHNGMILSFVDTLAGAGVRESHKTVLMDVICGNEEHIHMGKLLFNCLDADYSWQRTKVNKNNETAVGELFGKMVLHKLDPSDLSGHESKQSAEVCKSLLQRIQSELVIDLNSYFYNNKVSPLASNIYFPMISEGCYSHAIDLLYDLSETLISCKAKFDENASAKNV